MPSLCSHAFCLASLRFQLLDPNNPPPPPTPPASPDRREAAADLVDDEVDPRGLLSSTGVEEEDEVDTTGLLPSAVVDLFFLTAWIKS